MFTVPSVAQPNAQPNAQQIAQPKHIEFAQSMALEIVTNFGVIEQNEMFQLIQVLLHKERVKQIENTASQLDFLKQSIEGLRIS
jgi:hypothetical protein